MNPAALLGVVLTSCLLCFGCGNERCVVVGEVTCDGQPVENGTITLEPADRNGPNTGGKIIAGKFELTGEAAPLPGKKRVRISAIRKTGRKVKGDGFSPQPIMDEIDSYIPKKYNDNTTLSCEVVTGGPNRFDFPLKSSK